MSNDDQAGEPAGEKPPKPGARSLLQIAGLTKAFGGARALDGVALTVEPGRIQALLGHNGSGKSTLIKILAGYHTPDACDELVVNGHPSRFPLSAVDHERLHLGFVHQDLGLIPSLPVVDNLELGRVGGSAWFVSWRERRRRARKILEGIDIKIDVDILVGKLPPEDQAAIAVARAMQGIHGEGGGALLVLDEVTAFLPRERRESLYGIIRELAGAGCGVLFVSHDIDEIMEVCDTVTVLRNGRVVGSADKARVTVDTIIEMIIGRRLESREDARRPRSGEHASRVAVRQLEGRAVHDLTFEVGSGEIVGVTGVLGSGFDEIPSLLYGATKAKAGELVVDGIATPADRVEPSRSLKAGVRLVPSARLAEGLVGELPLTDNVTLPTLRGFVTRLLLRRKRMARACGELLDDFGVIPNDPPKLVLQLSGGNQQKALLAKMLQGSPTLVLLHEPTQGVDVGAREQIFRLVRRTADEGVAVMVASSDHAQLAAICERVIVVQDGRVVGELSGAEVSKKAITAAAYAVKSGSRPLRSAGFDLTEDPA